MLSIVAPQAWRSYRTRAPEPATIAEPSETVVDPQTEQPIQTPPEAATESSLQPVPAVPTASKSDFSVDVLLQMRDELRGIVGQLPSSELPVAKPQAAVQVTSEGDRLAMLTPTRIETQRRTLAAVPVRKLVQRQTPPREALLRFRPTVLFDQLQSLSTQPFAAQWSAQVHGELARLADDHTTSRSEALPIIDTLEALAVSGRGEASKAAYTSGRHQWFQAIQSLERRLAIWRAMFDPSVETQNSIVVEKTTPNLMASLSEVAVLLGEESNGEAWRDYLLLDQLAAATSEGAGLDQQGRGNLARKVLSRMNSAKLAADQKAFLATEPLTNLQMVLRPWAATAVNLDRLVALVERYEAGRELRFAVAIAQIQHQLHWSNCEQLQKLADHLDLHYRGSNLRLTLTEGFMNQMMPRQKPIVAPVNERIAGAKVRGQSRTTTSLHVRLIPDPAAWRFGLEASGKVYSTTRSETWPARVRNAAKMQYQARKVITINQQGLSTAPTRAKAQGRHELLGVESQLDPVPLLGKMLREIARSKNKKSRPKAMQQVKQKVVHQAQTRMDSQADSKFEDLAQKFKDHVLSRIARLALFAEPRSMFTTEERAVMQLRLANDGQLAAHTPRPLAPSDSAASLQLHETVLNNAIAGLQLNGRRMKVTELFEFFAEKFGRADAQPSEDLSRRAVIQFASRDAILVNCDNDRIELILNIREVAHGRDKIRNFQVHAYFRPVLDGFDVRLVRDGSLQFAGRRLKTGPRIVLHGIFGKLIEQDAEIRLMADGTQPDPRLNGLMVTQLVIDDGWIGLAIGPAHPDRTALQAAGPRAEAMMR